MHARPHVLRVAVMTDVEQWAEYLTGFLSASVLVVVAAAIRAFFDRRKLAEQRRIDVAEMVGAVRAELASVTRRQDQQGDVLHAVATKLDGISERLGEHLRAFDAHLAGVRAGAARCNAEARIDGQ